MNRSFIAEDYAEDKFGHWAKDEVTGEQGYVDDERSCFWTWEGPEREKEKAKDDPKGPEQHSLVMNKCKILNGGKKKTQFGGPKERKARRACQKAMMGSFKGGFRPYQSDKGASKDFHQNKGRGKDQKGKGKEGIYPQSGFSASETPNEEGYGRPGNQTTGLPVIGLTIPGLRMLGGSAQGVKFHGWWQPR